MNELKPCPFCGEVPYIKKKPLWKVNSDGAIYGYYGCFEYDIRCYRCGCNIPLEGNTTIYATNKEAERNVIRAWNRRVKQ